MKRILCIIMVLLFSVSVSANYGYMSGNEVITSMTDEESVRGYADNADGATLVLAYYSYDGRLLEARITNQAKTPDITVDENNTDGYFKLFVLDGVNSLKPQSKVEPLKHTYKTYVVGTVPTALKMITDLYRTSNQNNIYYFDDTDPDIIIDMKKVDGSASTLSAISKYNVLSIKEGLLNDGKKYIEVIVSDNTVTGKLASANIEDKEIVIENQKYILSDYFLKYATAKESNLTVGFYYNFYLDKDGKIAAFEETNNPNQMYAYVIYGDEAETSLCIIDQCGDRIIFPIADEISIDGVPYEKKYIFDILQKSNGISQLIKYTINKAGQLNTIDTVTHNACESELSLTLGIMRSDFKYKSSTRNFSSVTSAERFSVDTNTIVFSIPSDITLYDQYSVQTYNVFDNGAIYTVEAYNITNTSVPKAKCIVVYN